MKKSYILLASLLVIAPGCGGRKNKAEKKPKSDETTEISIPTAGDSVKVFDEELNEFTLVDDVQKSAQLANAQVNPEDFSFIDQENNSEFKRVYFDYDKYAIKKDQESALNDDITHAMKVIKDNPHKNVTLVVSGHACTSGNASGAYNFALSEKRAKIVADKLVAAGVPQEHIKIVGRGYEMPALDSKGNPVTGNRQQQWPNRRDEIQFIVS